MQGTSQDHNNSAPGGPSISFLARVTHTMGFVPLLLEDL